MATEEQKAECKCLCCALERDFRLRGKDSTQNVSNLDRVRRDFGGQRATALGAEEIDQYVESAGEKVRHPPASTAHCSCWDKHSDWQFSGNG